ncbi:MAG: cyclase family protein [Dehalococcoidia bacterium]|nr:cyclase family protein [Dehalococcoidia bacterium]MYA53798.1 cyclase family protein [Dehalococcoidia bacterium]
MTSSEHPPTQSEVLGYFDSLSNWDRWGPDDQLGALNYITPGKRRDAASLVREGISVSCAWDIGTAPRPDHLFGVPQRYMVATGRDPLVFGRGGAALEVMSLAFHGATVTHLDGLSHIFWDGKMYNGKPADLVTAQQGASHFAVTELGDGIVTRGVLMDIPALDGRPWLEPGEGVFPEHLEAAEERQGVRVSTGDIVLLRTGKGRRQREEPDGPASSGGWHVASLPWLHEREVAVIGADTAQEAGSSGYEAIPVPVHMIAMVAMGVHLIDNCDLEALARTCERLNRWEFFLSVQPLRLEGGTGSAVNPVAVF